jgi:fructokinase
LRKLDKIVFRYLEKKGERAMAAVYGGIEAGGTKFVCAVGTGPGDVREEIRFPTGQPKETLEKAIEFFIEQEQKYGKLAGIGIAAFGPVDLKRDSSFYGFITSTPKPGWANTDIVGIVKKAVQVPIGFDTDVNGAAIGEWRWGAAQGLDTFVYLTIGTGIGGGGMVNGRLIHGMLHPEMGHILIPHDRHLDPFPGSCPYHGDCLEGLATGPAIEKRWGRRGENLALDHPAWELEAHYIALALCNYILTFSPQRIILGGGVMAQQQLFPLICKKVQKFLNGYICTPEILDQIDSMIVPPGLGSRAGVLGAIALGYLAAEQN